MHVVSLYASSLYMYVRLGSRWCALEYVHIRVDKEDGEEERGLGRKYGYPTVPGEVEYRVRCGVVRVEW